MIIRGTINLEMTMETVFLKQTKLKNTIVVKHYTQLVIIPPFLEITKKPLY